MSGVSANWLFEFVPRVIQEDSSDPRKQISGQAPKEELRASPRKKSSGKATAFRDDLLAVVTHPVPTAVGTPLSRGE
jgi:hypothetical protein